jgi:hypothetical protein
MADPLGDAAVPVSYPDQRTDIEEPPNLSRDHDAGTYDGIRGLLQLKTKDPKRFNKLDFRMVKEETLQEWVQNDELFASRPKCPGTRIVPLREHLQRTTRIDEFWMSFSVDQQQNLKKNEHRHFKQCLEVVDLFSTR